MISAELEPRRMREPPYLLRTETSEAGRTRVPRTRRFRIGSRFIGLGLICCGAGMLPWLVTLATWLPASTRVFHWSIAWVGLDALEVISLVVTGWLFLRADRRCCLAAAGTAMLLLADTWFDLTTAQAGTGFLISILMAICAELPMIALCGVLAIRSLPRREA